MAKYKIVFFLNAHLFEVVDDVIENILKHNDDCCIILNNGSRRPIRSDRENVIVVDRQISMDRYFTLIPTHYESYLKMRELGIEGDYVVLFALNQLFIRDGFYEYISQYDGGFFDRELNRWEYSIPNEWLEKFGENNFKYHSNHDGMFFLFHIFCDMMEILSPLGRTSIAGHLEEFLYVAYLFYRSDESRLAMFSKYNYWPPSWSTVCDYVASEDDLNKAIEIGSYMIKRVSYNYYNPLRKYIRENL